MMPVWLDAIPEKADSVKRPDTRRWLICLIVVLSTGILITTGFWQAERDGFLFWLSAVGLPLCLWGLLFCCRRVAYKAGQVGAQSWNDERQQLIARETELGQRPAWILDSHAETYAGQYASAIAEVIDSGSPVLRRYAPPGQSASIQYAALTDRDLSAESARQYVVARFTTRIAEVLAPLRSDLNCWLLIDCNCAAADQAEVLINQQLNTHSGRAFKRISQSGMAGFDYWLDQAAETPSVLVAISLNLPDVPQAGGADAITTTVLANRPSALYPQAARLHRPEQGSSSALDQTLKRALLWAAIPAQSLKRAWITGKTLTQGAAWSNACDSNNVTFSMSTDLTAPDSVIGYSGISAPWLMIALAQLAVAAGEAQGIACQPAAHSEDVWVMVIKRD